MSGQIGQIKPFLTIRAFQVTGSEALHTFYRTGIAHENGTDFVETIQRAFTDMSGVIALISIIAGIDTCIVIEEGFIPPRVETLGTVGGTITLKTGVIAGGAEILDLVIAGIIEEESSIVLVGSLRTGEVALIIERTTIVDL